MFLVLSHFEETCKRQKDKIAVIYKDEKITYNDLRDNAKKIGTYLSNYVKSNDPVIVFMDKGIDAIESFLGTLYSGGCYSFMNTEHPEKRINQIKDILNNRIVITNDKYEQRAKELFNDKKVFNINELLKTKIDEEKLNEIQKSKLDIDPVYINFTSGSTGIPKGVIVSNDSIIDFMNVFTEKFEIKENDIIANQAPLDFDVSVKDIYSAFFKGATLLLIPKEYFSKPAELLDYLCDNKATTLIWAVSALCLITTFHALDYKIPENVNKVIFSGEIMPIKHLNIWMEKLPQATFINVYGPTEITCNCTYHIIDRKREYIDYIPIGKAFENEKVFLLDENNKLITDKDRLGEICVCGSFLALGYYNNWDQTSEHFVQNPLNKNYIELMYKTGDLGKYDENNDLIFSGRKDFQIKYMGHRIELEEIDNAISKVDGIIRTCTIFDEEKNKIYGFYIGNLDKKELKIILNKELPVYMIPTKLIKCDEFPMTKNGKIDRKELLRSFKESKTNV